MVKDLLLLHLYLVLGGGQVDVTDNKGFVYQEWVAHHQKVVHELPIEEHLYGVEVHIYFTFLLLLDFDCYCNLLIF